MKIIETHADREENLRLLSLEQFERLIFDDYLMALSEASLLTPSEILSILHEASFDYFYSNLKEFESGGISYTQHRSFRGHTPLEIAFSFYITDNFTSAMDMGKAREFDKNTLKKRAWLILDTRSVFRRHRKFSE